MTLTPFAQSFKEKLERKYTKKVERAVKLVRKKIPGSGSKRLTHIIHSAAITCEVNPVHVRRELGID